MRNYLMTAIGAAMLFAAPAASAQSSDGMNRWVSINNVSVHTVLEVYAVPTHLRAGYIASPDLIPSATIRPGESYRINFDDGRGTCRYDIRATSQSGVEWVKRDFDVCARSKLDLTS